MNDENMSAVEKQLEHMFHILNREYFDGKLDEPAIVVKSDLKNRQKISTNKIWSGESINYYEISISAGLLNEPINEIAAALLHQCVHLWNLKCGIKDVSRGGAYHNKRFRDSAEEHGLKVKYDAQNGWVKTSATHQLSVFVQKQNWMSFSLKRNRQSFDGTNHTRKYICPKCKNSVRATKIVRISCIDCNQPMVEEVKDII